MPRIKTICPCGDNEFTLTYKNEDVNMENLFCPFCTASLEDEDTNKEIVAEDDE